jgi:hypothetical protein
MRSEGSFNVRAKNHYGEFGFNPEKKRVSEKFSLIKPKDVDAGSFGHGKRKTVTKQHYFDKKTKKVKKRDNIWWDLHQEFTKKKHKKHELELELFDPNMKRRMKLGT